MNKERNMKPMTKEEEYRNADVPMPEEDIEAMKNAGITYTDVIQDSKSDEFKKIKEAADQEQDYQGGGAYRAFLELFYKNKKGKDE